MLVDKVLNNNVISALDESGREIILVGRGLGWNAQSGQPVDRSRIEKIFRMDTPASTDRLKQLFLEVEVEAIRASTRIVDHARSVLKKRLNKNVYITLTDHISFAAKRQRDGITFHNMLNWETKKLYPLEFGIGVKALDIVRETMGVALPEGEAASIAIHIINAEYDCDMEKMSGITDIIQKSLNVVRYTFRVNFDEESLDYQRFVTHMLFFAQRVVENRMNHGEKDFLYDMMRREHPKEFSCACRIRELIQKEYDVRLPEDEITFLCVHIVRVTAKKDQI